MSPLPGRNPSREEERPHQHSKVSRIEPMPSTPTDEILAGNGQDHNARIGPSCGRPKEQEDTQAADRRAQRPRLALDPWEGTEEILAQDPTRHSTDNNVQRQRKI